MAGGSRELMSDFRRIRRPALPSASTAPGASAWTKRRKERREVSRSSIGRATVRAFSSGRRRGANCSMALPTARCRHREGFQPSGGRAMPEKETLKRARQDKRAGKAPTTQAGEFVREEIHHVREGKHGARS